MALRTVSKSTMRLAAIQLGKTLNRGLSGGARYRAEEMKNLARTYPPNQLREKAEELKAEVAKRKAAQALRQKSQ